ncbi:hypothetical protein LTS17_001135 [Exophiala oligosperma]
MESESLSPQGRKRKQLDTPAKSNPKSKRRPQRQRRFDFDVQVEDYKIWRRQGAWHDPVCLECRKPDDLILCQTCKRAYHQNCMPKTSSFCSRTRKLYCVVCVELSWDVSPPDVSASATPEPEPAGDSDYLRLQTRHGGILNSSEDIARPTVGYGSTAHQRQVPDTTHNPSSDTRTPAPTPAAIAANDRVRQNADEPLEYTQSPERTAPSQNMALSTNDDDLWSLYKGTRDYSKRRSRFATLPTKIDESLSTLYQELATSTFLRQKLSELEAKVRALEQEKQMQKNQIILLEQSRTGTFMSDQELAEMRALISQGQSASTRLEELSNKYEALQAEFQRQGADLLAKDEALSEWKGKLKAMLGE